MPSARTRLQLLMPCVLAVAVSCAAPPAVPALRQRVGDVVVGPPAVAGIDGPVGVTMVDTPAAVWAARRPVQVTTASLTQAASARPPLSRDWQARPRPVKHRPPRRDLPQHPAALPHAAPDTLPPPDRATALHLAQTAATPNVDVATLADTGALPPDTMGDVGPTQYLAGLNGRLRSVSKATGAADGALDLDSDDFFQPVRGAGATSDPRVRFDRRTGRWYVLMITVALPNRFVLAVSSGATLTPATSWALHQWQNTRREGGAPAGPSCLADYPTLGVDEDALYIGVNQFCGVSVSGLDFDSTSVYVVRKAALVTGTLVLSQFDAVLPNSTSDGIYTPQGVDNFDAGTDAGFVIGVDNRQFGNLIVHRIANPGATPSISGIIAVTVPETGFPIDVPHPGGVVPLDGLDDRLLQAVVRNGRLWTAQQIQVNAVGQADTSGGRNGIRWYEIGALDATPALVQAGTVFDPAPTTPASVFMGAIMANGQGHAALGMTAAGAATRVNAAFTGRLASDPPGAMDAPVLYTANTAFSYNQQGSPATTQRWGDYSYTSVDPNDDMTFWTLQQYVNATNSYAVRLVRLQAPPPPPIAAVTPNVIDPGVPAVVVQVTGAAGGGAGFFDPADDVPQHLAVSFGAGVTVVSTTVTSPTSLTLVLDTTAAAAGPRPLTVTNPDGQAVTLGSALVIGASTPAPPVFSGVPADLALFDAGSGATTGPRAFVVADPQGTPVTLTASSSNTAVIPQSHVVVGGSGVNRTVTVSSIGQYGASTITLTASSGGDTTTASFLVTVHPSGVPGPPQHLAALVQRNRVSFSWQAPPTASFEPVSSYRLEAGYAPGQTVAVLPVGSALSYTLFAAPDGVFYVRLKAVTAAGVSAASNEVRIATGQTAPPLAPLALLATVQGTAVSFRWTENPAGPVITSYQLRAGTAPGLSNVAVAPFLPAVRSLAVGAPPGTYYVRVVAMNAAGESAASNEAVVVAQPGTCTIPAAPEGFSASTLPGRLTVRWDPPASGAIPTSYVIHAGSAAGAADRFVVGLPGDLTAASGLVPDGPYFLRLFAANACGTSPASPEASATVTR